MIDAKKKLKQKKKKKNVAVQVVTVLGDNRGGVIKKAKDKKKS